LQRGHLAMAVTSVQLMSGCWKLEDLDRLELAVEHVYRAEGLSASTTPLYAFGASSGGAMAGKLAETAKVGRTYLKCRIPQIMSTAGTPKFHALLGDGQQVSWPAPPTLFIHMPRDARTAARVTQALTELRTGGVVTTELHCKPLPIDSTFFAARIPGVSTSMSETLARALRTGGFVDDKGLLLNDPRSSDDWREALASTGVPEALEDGLAPDESRINEEMNLAWAGHEMCASFASEMLEFCEDPQATCAKYGWTC